MVGGFFFAPPSSNNVSASVVPQDTSISHPSSSITLESLEVLNGNEKDPKPGCTQGVRQNVTMSSYKDILNVDTPHCSPLTILDFEVSPKVSCSKDGEPAFILTNSEFQESLEACK